MGRAPPLLWQRNGPPEPALGARTANAECSSASRRRISPLWWISVIAVVAERVLWRSTLLLWWLGCPPACRPWNCFCDGYSCAQTTSVLCVFHANSTGSVQCVRVRFYAV